MRRGSFLYAGALGGCSFLALLLHSCISGPVVRREMHVGEIMAVPSVQVGLGRCLRDVQGRIAIRGPYEVHGRHGVVAQGDELGWTDVGATGTAVVLGGQNLRESPVTVRPLRDSTLEVQYLRDGRGNPTPPTSVRYHGVLRVHALPGDRIALVNEVDLEEYLKGVVGKEMSLSEGAEALKAQVMAARTYALQEQRLGRVRHVRGEPFDLYDDERSQVYGGRDRETALAAWWVEETRGQVVVYENSLVRTFYSSACGGATEPAWEVMGEEAQKIPPLGGRTCDYCRRRPAYRWKEPAVFTKREIAQRCLPGDLAGGKIKGMAITRTLPGGHAGEVTLSLENTSRTVKLQAQDFRRRLSPSPLRSTLWDQVQDRGDSIAILGRGYGHGVGMCQIGAYEMARDGHTAEQILAYYFPGATIAKLY